MNSDKKLGFLRYVSNYRVSDRPICINLVTKIVRLIPTNTNERKYRVIMRIKFSLRFLKLRDSSSQIHLQIVIEIGDYLATLRTLECTSRSQQQTSAAV